MVFCSCCVLRGGAEIYINVVPGTQTKIQLLRVRLSYERREGYATICMGYYDGNGGFTVA